MSIKSELTKTTSYLRESRNAIKARGGQISDTAGFKDLPEAINSIPSGSSNNSLLPKIVDGSIVDLTEDDLRGATKIKAHLFRDCSSINSIEIPNGVTTIETYAFENSSLKKITLPDSLQEIENYAFKDVQGADVHIADIAKWCGVTVGNNTSTPFNKSGNLYLDGKLTTELIIPNTVTDICGYVFYYCASIERVVFPNSLTTIGTLAFSSCGNCLEYDFTAATAVPTLKSSNVFRYLDEACKFKVPAALYDEWVATTNWTNYAAQIVAV